MDVGMLDGELHQLSEFLEARLGLHFSKDRWPDLERGIHSAMKDFSMEENLASVQSLLSTPLTKRRIEILASHLTVGETYFLRERKAFDALEQHILPELVRLRHKVDRRLRIWSAGCCTGEEAYSIAMTVAKIVPNMKDWNITILATDINPGFLRKAEEGTYGDWSFRDVPAGTKDAYFTRTPATRYRVHSSLKKMVQFSYLNLAEDSYPSLLNNTNAMDIIFCRNVLMYFTPSRAQKVIQNLHSSLVDGGWLIVSATEASNVLFSRFAMVNFPGITLYRKDAWSSQNIHYVNQIPTSETDEMNIQPAESPEGFATQENNDISDLLKKKTDVAGGDSPAQRNANALHEVVLLYERRLYPQAQKRIEELLMKHQSDAKLMALRARIYANLGKLSEAREWAQKAADADKLNAGYRYLLATIFQEEGQVEGATNSLKQALYIDERFVLAYFALGNILRGQGKTKMAAKYHQNALGLLRKLPGEEILPESEGMTASRLAEVIQSIDEEHLLEKA